MIFTENLLHSALCAKCFTNNNIHMRILQSVNHGLDCKNFDKWIPNWNVNEVPVDTYVLWKST